MSDPQIMRESPKFTFPRWAKIVLACGVAWGGAIALRAAANASATTHQGTVLEEFLVIHTLGPPGCFVTKDPEKGRTAYLVQPKEGGSACVMTPAQDVANQGDTIRYKSPSVQFNVGVPGAKDYTFTSQAFDIEKVE